MMNVPIRTTLVASAIFVTAALSGCISPSAPAAPTDTSRPSAQPSESPSALPLGAAAEFPNLVVTAHALDLDSSPPPAPQPQRETDRWVSLDIEICNGYSQTATASGEPWGLVTADNRRFTSSDTGYSTFPVPDVTFGADIAAGECVRGWVTFVVAKDAVLESVLYSNSGGDRATWQL